MNPFGAPVGTGKRVGKPGSRLRNVLAFCSALGDDRDGAARFAPELGLVVRCQNPQLLNRVHVRLIIDRTVRPGIHIGDAINGKVNRGKASVDVEAAD